MDPSKTTRGPENAADPTLRSWKEIAAHFGVTVRTVQKWEKERGLPVHRQPAFERPRVWARKRELDRWRGLSDGTEAPHRHGEPRDPSWGWLAALVAAMVLAVVAVDVLLRRQEAHRDTGEAIPHLDPTIARVSVEGPLVRALGANDELLWQREFPDRWPRKTPPLTLVDDIDGDGRREVLFEYIDRDRIGKGGRLVCLEHDGSDRWSIEHGEALRRGARSFPKAFGGRYVGVVDVAGRRRVLSIAVHQPWYPSVVSLIEPTAGTIEDRYYHPGYLGAVSLADLDGDGSDELLLGGVNNPGDGLGHPALVVLDLPFGERATVDFFGNSGPRELTYVLLASNAVFRAVGGNAVQSVAPIDPTHVVVSMGSEDDRRVYVTLDLSDLRDVRVLDVRPSDAFRVTHANLFGVGRIDHRLVDEEHAALGRILMFDSAPDGNSPEIRQRFDSLTMAGALVP